MIPLQRIDDDVISESGVQLYVLRLDLNHPHISGNKLYKLKYNLEEAKKQNQKTILTFGGVFSNHIAATAAAGKEYNFKTIGIIRGEKPKELNPTLQFALSCGMELHFVSREEYRNKNEISFLEELKNKFSDFFLIPEGGANEQGIKGCAEINAEINIPFDTICCACGTGTTLAGIILSLKNNQRAIGFQVLKGENYIQTEISNWSHRLNFTSQNNWSINENFHFDGYAKSNSELINFIKKIEKDHEIPLDPIYTGKMMFGIYSMIRSGAFKKGETIIAIHTGGLQGNLGFYSQT